MILDTIEKLERDITQGMKQAPRRTLFLLSGMVACITLVFVPALFMLSGNRGELSPLASLHDSLPWTIALLAGTSVLLFIVGLCLSRQEDEREE